MVDPVFDVIVRALRQRTRQQFAGAHGIFLVQKTAHPRARIFSARLDPVDFGGPRPEQDLVVGDVPAPVTQSPGGQRELQAVGGFAQCLPGERRVTVGTLARRQDVPRVLQGSGTQ